ncbi:hypothetical protein FB567DRAFT_586464 [Paraphoma chrysanthemicola]|uniref:Uncharacterized protein n=1 Tax=Paraphoma chrysanthemicola TaxID=798071 RepID=A0A8K0RIK4_9PLEO|nr:hypothetical protein FB567DRAFT_586464 [Paraphoma chrysanthemicola]
MADLDKKTSAQFEEPISPSSTQPDLSTASSTSSSTKPSITGILKNAVTAPPAEKRESSSVQDAIESIGDDGGAKGN